MRTRYVDDRQAFEAAVEEYAQQGYDITAKDDQRAICVGSDWGRWYIHVLLAIFTIGFGNVLYGLYKAMTADKVEVVVRDE